jgi:hypothetical protein
VTVAALALVIAVSSTAAARFGVVVDSPEPACVAIEGAEIGPGTELTVVQPELPQQVFTAHIDRPKACTSPSGPASR